MTMYHEKTYRQRFGLTIEAAKALKAETLNELTEIGFTNIPKATSGETCDAMWEQIDNDKSSTVWNKVMDATVDYYETELIDEHNFDKFVERWVEAQVECLFPNE